MKPNHILNSVVIFLLAFLTSCNMQDMLKDIMEENKLIRDTLKENCDCDEISSFGISQENTTKSASYKLIGCEYDSLDVEAERILILLKEKDDKLCELDHFHLTFINKYKQRTVVIEDCEIKEITEKEETMDFFF